MLMGKEFDPFFAQIVRTLGPYLDDILCIGGCANALYRFHDLASPMPWGYLGTKDVDVATETDAEGRIVKANYGKIYGPIQYGQGGDKLDAVCYFNPEVNDRNLEFDPKHDLAGQRYDWP